jgi:hypothetical protein
MTPMGMKRQSRTTDTVRGQRYLRCLDTNASTARLNTSGSSQ